MVKIQCPVQCGYETEDLDQQYAVDLMSKHTEIKHNTTSLSSTTRSPSSPLNLTVNVNQNQNQVQKTDVNQIVVVKEAMQLGFNQEDAAKFLTLLDEDNESREVRLQKLVRLTKDNTLTHSICLIRYRGPSGKWHGTGFLARLPGKGKGIALFSAGHNFHEKNLLDDFENFSFLFNNTSGALYPKDQKGIKTKTMDVLLSEFSCTVIITHQGQQLIKISGKSLIRQPHPNLELDYFIMHISDSDAEERLKGENLDFLDIDSGKKLKKKREPVYIFGYPGFEQCICCRNSNKCKCKQLPAESQCLCKTECFCAEAPGLCRCTTPCHHPPEFCKCEHPLRFSHGNLNENEQKMRMIYDLDTKEGNSGSPVSGAEYTVEGIHVSTKGNLNAAQCLKPVLKDIQNMLNGDTKASGRSGDSTVKTPKTKDSLSGRFFRRKRSLDENEKGIELDIFATKKEKSDSGLDEPSKASQALDKMKSVSETDVIRLVLLGTTGEGKSLFGNYVISPDNKQIFKVGNGWEPCTSAVQEYEGCLRRQSQRPCIVVDTPGLDDTLGRDSSHLSQIVECLQKFRHVTAFVLVMEKFGRFSTSLNEMLHVFESSFGHFWSNLVIKVREKNKCEEWMEKLSEKFPSSRNFKIKVFEVDCDLDHPKEEVGENIVKFEETIKQFKEFDCSSVDVAKTERDEFRSRLSEQTKLFEDLTHQLNEVERENKRLKNGKSGEISKVEDIQKGNEEELEIFSNIVDKTERNELKDLLEKQATTLQIITNKLETLNKENNLLKTGLTGDCQLNLDSEETFTDIEATKYVVNEKASTIEVDKKDSAHSLLVVKPDPEPMKPDQKAISSDLEKFGAPSRTETLIPRLSSRSHSSLARVIPALNPKRKHRNLELSQNKLRAYCDKDTALPAIVQATHHIQYSNQTDHYYFEMKVITSGSTGIIYIGLAGDDCDLLKPLGLENGTYGYHGSSGKIYNGSGIGEQYGPTYSTGDTVGCGINLKTGVGFYTQNGKNLGFAFKVPNVDTELYPTFGIYSRRGRIEVNLGNEEFLFDQSHLEKYINAISQQVENENTRKIVVVGDGAVGKNCLCQVFINKRFPTNNPSTFQLYNVKQTYKDREEEISLWETRGHEEFFNIRRYPGTHLFLLCFSLNSETSFDNVASKWLPSLRTTDSPSVPAVPILLVGTKSDIRALPIKEKDIQELKKKFQLSGYVECSAKDGQDSITQVFERAIDICLEEKKTTWTQCYIL